MKYQIINSVENQLKETFQFPLINFVEFDADKEEEHVKAKIEFDKLKSQNYKIHEGINFDSKSGKFDPKLIDKFNSSAELIFFVPLDAQINRRDFDYKTQNDKVNKIDLTKLHL